MLGRNGGCGGGDRRRLHRDMSSSSAKLTRRHKGNAGAAAAAVAMTAAAFAAVQLRKRDRGDELQGESPLRRLASSANAVPVAVDLRPSRQYPPTGSNISSSNISSGNGNGSGSGSPPLMLATSTFSPFSTPDRSAFEKDYRVNWNNKLGEGGFGTVHVAEHRKTGEKVAVKRVPKRPHGNQTQEAAIRYILDGVQRERNALRHIQRGGGGHPHIVSIRDEYGSEPDLNEDPDTVDHSHDDKDYFYLVLELVSGGELFDHLCMKGAYSEADAARLVREVASALAFLHGIGVVHGDLKPENLLMSTRLASSAAIKLVDFGTAIVTDPTSPYFNAGDDDKDKDGDDITAIATTPGYSSPELLNGAEKQREYSQKIHNGEKGVKRPTKYVPDPSIDMWSLGVILYILLTGAHPFDLSGTSEDEEMNVRVRSKASPPLRNAKITEHLSESAISLLSQLLEWDPKKRLTASDLLQHPWVLGETAQTNKMTGSDKRLKTYRRYKSKLEAKVFASMVGWSDDYQPEGAGQVEVGKDRSKLEEPKKEEEPTPFQGLMNFAKYATGKKDTSEEDELIAKRTSLIERSFQMLNPDHHGYITTKELGKLVEDDVAPANADEDDVESLSLSCFSDLLAENMKNRYYPAGHVVYKEGDVGHKMYFINSGQIEVSTKDGFRTVSHRGDFFGEGALLHPKSIRSATIKTLTPVHALEISREYFEKYIADEYDLHLNLREKDKSRKRQRAKSILKMQQNTVEREFKKGEFLFQLGEDGNELFILEEGLVDVVVENHTVFVAQPGGLTGEHSLIMGKPRNTSAKCATDSCKCLVLRGSDFLKLMDSHPSVKESMREICMRREFQKALVFKMNKPFPDHANEEALRDAFNAAGGNISGKLVLSDFQSLLKRLDPTLTDSEIREILASLDIDKTGSVSFDEFKAIYGNK